MPRSTSSAAARRAKRSLSPGFVKDLQTLADSSPSPILQSLNDISRDGWSGKTYPVFCLPTAEGHLAPCSGAWQNSGMGMPIGCWTLNTPEHMSFPEQSPSDGAVCSLWDILETGDVPRRFFLTAKACAGILRRAEKRGKELPEALRVALQSVVEMEHRRPNSETT